MRIPKKKKTNVYEVGLGAERGKCNIYPRCRIVAVSHGGMVLILTPAWCHNESVVIAHGGKC